MTFPRHSSSLRPQDLPGWVIGAGPPITLWHNGATQCLSHDVDLSRALDGLGRPDPHREPVSAAVAPWFGVPASGERLLVACAPGPRAPLWRACLSALAVSRGYAVPTPRPERLLECVAVWTFGFADDAATLEPLWCTAAAAGLPLVWVPYPRLAEGLALLPRFSGLSA